MKEQQLYQKYSDGRHWENHPTLYAERFSEFLKEKKFGGLIADLGCGDGRDVNVFSENGFNALGIDCSEKEIANAKHKFPDLKFEVQDAEALQFKNNSVDSFFMINVIHYLDKKKAIEEILRTLKTKGYLFIHFNVEIRDINGKLDYQHSENNIRKLISKFNIVHENIFERTDYKPVEHRHIIMELILQKK
jgi:ubiquinone/menaquinone biosynthesis C-methylase UbiE